ncbi:MAG: hypothetical protein QMD71_08870 [bacterium]|nr:hypothetical protein [bacterium]
MDWIKCIKEDKESGANELRELAAKAILEFITKPHSKDSLFDFLNQLAIAKPTMAPIKVLVKSIITETKDLKELNFIDQKVRAIVTTAPNLAALIKNAHKVLTNKKVVLTYSYSSTVFEALRTLNEISVFISESRPNFEGRKLALKLREAGLKVIFITEAEISRFIRDVEVIVVGADRVTEDSVINKVGTLAIAIMAKEFKVPCYVVCGIDKFLSKKEAKVEEIPENPNEIWTENGIKILNFYFEEIPIKYFTGIITEQGIISQKLLSKKLQEKRNRERTNLT